MRTIRAAFHAHLAARRMDAARVRFLVGECFVAVLVLAALAVAWIA